MKVILMQQIPKLGSAGDIVAVAPGYGRNYLIAQGLAREATVDAQAASLAVRQKRAAKREQDAKERERVRAALSGQTILIRASANEEGHLFGGVGPKEIAESISKRKKIQVKERSIKLAHHLKTLGNHEVVLDLGGGGSITIVVDIARNE